MRTAVYAGSFDPLTNGHLWMIQEGLKLFDHLYVAIGTNPSKNYTFSVEDRLDMIRESVGDLDRLTISEFNNRYLVDYAKELKSTNILRGIRSPADYEFERMLRHINYDMEPSITTIFLMPPRPIAELSSSMIKGLIGPVGWQKIVQKYVPEPVFKRLDEKMN